MQTCDGVEPASIVPAISKSQSYLRSSRHTSAELIYSPSQIALSCLFLVSPALVEAYLSAKESKAGQGKKASVLERKDMLRLLQEIGDTITHSQKNPIEKEKVKDVDKRLKWARNPEKDPSSALYVALSSLAQSRLRSTDNPRCYSCSRDRYKKRKQEEEAEKERKEREKAAKRPKIEDDGSVFD